MSEQITRKGARSRWTREEHVRVLTGLRKNGKDWGRVAEYVPSKTRKQVYDRALSLVKKLSKNPSQETEDILEILRGP